MNEPKITLELTPAEVILLQELTEDMELSYLWMFQIGETLREKAVKAYRKPTMSRRKYLARLDKVKDLFGTEQSLPFMLAAEKRELKFYYDIEEGEE